MADDYSFSIIARAHGFFGSQLFWYKGWTGRFSFNALASLLGWIGPATPRFVPALLLALWFAATVWAIYGVHPRSGEISAVRVVLFAGFLIFATLETSPNVVQSLYWQTGALTYVAPFIPLSLFVGLVGLMGSERPKLFPKRAALAGVGILVFVANGFSDAYMVLQTGSLVLLILLVEIFAGVEFKRRIRPFLLVGVIGSLLALVVVVVAPGNSIRQAYFPLHPGPWSILKLTAYYSVGFLGKLVLDHPFVSLTSLALPLLIRLRDFGRGEKRTWDRRLCLLLLVITPAMVFVLITSCTASGIWAMSVMLPERARILLSFVFICGTVIWSRAAGEYLAGRLLLNSRDKQNTVSLAVTVALFLLILVPQISFFSTLRRREQARSYAADWERQDRELKTAKQTGIGDVTVPQIGDFQSRIGMRPPDLYLRTDPSFWINRTIATYYGLTSVRATDDVASSR